MRIQFDPDAAGPATGFLYPLAVSFKLALPTFFSRQHSGFALRRFNPDLRRLKRFRLSLTFLPFPQVFHSMSEKLARGSKAFAVRSVRAGKGLTFGPHNPALGFSVLGACVFR
jgi:hypothetical protein